MTTTEHLLTCLSEECAEVIQTVSKALRFGLDTKHCTDETKTTTNRDDIALECQDMLAAIELLQEHGVINKSHPFSTTVKKEKILKYIDYAKSVGTISDATN